MSHAAYISEIFSSIQGEGPHTGEKMTFVRFAGCSLGCRYCDTPGGICSRGSFTIEEPPGSARFDVRPNPTGAAALCDILASFDDDTVAVTGGEPLEQSEFLAEWLPSVFHSRRVLLETNGVHAEALGLVAPSVHIISMDIKLPSSSGVGPMWKEHGAFLEKAASSGKEIYVKIVVTSRTTDRDIGEAIRLVSNTNRFIPVVIQPASPTPAFHMPASRDRIDSIVRLFGAWLPDVRVMPQMHKEWGIL